MADIYQALLGATSSFDQAVSSAKPKVQANYTAAQQLAQAQASDQIAISNNEVIVNSVLKQGQLDTQAASDKAAEIFGTDLRSQGEVMSGLAAQRNQIYQGTMKQLQVVQQKESVDFFSDPLAYIESALTIDDEKAKADSLGKQLSLIDTQIQNNNVLTQQTVSTQKAISHTISQSSIEAENAKIKSEADLKANESKIRALSMNTDAIQANLSMSKEQIAAKSTAFQAQQSVQSQQIALAHLAMAQENQRRALEKDKQSDAMEGDIIKTIQVGYAAANGGKNLVLSPLEAKKIIGFVNTNSPLGKEYFEYYRLGNAQKQTGAVVYGATPANYLQFKQDVNFKVPAGMEPVDKVVTEARNQVLNAIKTGSKESLAMVGLPPTIDMKKDQELIVTAINRVAQANLQAQAKNPTAYTGGVFTLPDIKTILAQPSVHDSVKNLPVVTKVLAPAIAAGIDTSSPASVYGLVKKAVDDKVITVTQASDLGLINKLAAKVNVEVRRPYAAGLVVEGMDKYPVPLSPNGPLVDVTSAGEVTRQLMKDKALDITRKLGVQGDVAGAISSIAQDVSQRTGITDFIKSLAAPSTPFAGTPMESPLKLSK